MCLLAYCDHEATPDYDGLWNASINNPDGFGWAVHLGDRIIQGHSMEASVAIESYEEAVKDHPGTPSMYHARYATHGATDLANCHPFTVGEGGTVLAHNGIMPKAPLEKDRSDTRWFAEVELPRRGLQILDKPNKSAKLEAWLSSKVVLFTTEESLKYGVYILNEQDGEWVDGIWWSNDSYKHIYTYTYSGMYGLSAHTVIAKEDDYEACPEACKACGSVLSYDEAQVFGYCYTCECCLDCGEDFGMCLCYQGKQATQWALGGWAEEDLARATDIAVSIIKNN